MKPLAAAIPFALALALSTPLAALAAPPADAATLSMRAHFDAGVRHYDAKPPDFARALDEFRAAYRDKPSPIIKQNIALCLRAVGRYVEAVDTLREMLDEGGDAIKPGVRDLATKAIAEMNDLVATVKITIEVQRAASSPEARPALIVDGALVPSAKMGEPLRLDPGEHRFRVHAEGFADAAKSVTVAQGQHDVAIVLVLMPMLTSDPPAATPMATEPPPIAPPPTRYDTAPRQPPNNDAKKRRSYGLVGLSLQTEQLRLTKALDETNETKRTFNGAALIVRGGRYVDKYWDVGGLAELGVLSAESYASPASPATSSVLAHTGIVNFVLAPELRVHSTGQLRLIGSVALGVEATFLAATLGQSNGTLKSTSGSGVGVLAMLEAGGQLELGKAFVEGVVFFDVHGIGGMTTSTPSGEQRIVSDTAVGRAGLRLLVGFRF